MSANVSNAIDEITGHLDVSWLNTLQAHISRVCCIEITQSDGSISSGTGFLINENWVITNYHVLEHVIEREKLIEQNQSWAKPGEVAFRFGYRMQNGSAVPTEGEIYSLSKADQEKGNPWLVASSPNTPDGLDFAIIELDDALGKRRGWINLSEEVITDNLKFLVILQHPRHEPMKISWSADTDAALDTEKKRLVYKVKTAVGTSGGPCFDKNGSLVAVHSSEKSSSERMGIPSSAIVHSLRTKNIALPKRFVTGRQPATIIRGSSYAQLSAYRYRFLECLDSVRYDYRKIKIGLREFREINAKCETIMALIMGDGIVLPENQFMDSRGWLTTFKPLIEAGDRVGVIPQVRVAIRNSRLNLYETAARMVETFPESKPDGRFILSAYPIIDRDYDARLRLADYLRKLGANQVVKESPIEKYDKDWELMRVVLKQIQYFDTVENSVEQADYLPPMFSGIIDRVCKLDQRTIETDLQKFLGEKFSWETVDKILQLFRQCVLDFKEKFPDKDMTTRSQFLDALEKYRKGNKKVARGADELINSIYNFFMSNNVHANSYSDNTGGDADDDFIYTGHKIAEYMRLHMPKTGVGKMISPAWGWQAPTEQTFQQLVIERDNGQTETDDEAGEDETEIRIANELPWDDVLEIFKHDKWKRSLDHYLQARQDLEEIERIQIEYKDKYPDVSASLERVSDDRYKALRDAFQDHLRLSGQMIAEQSSGWKFTEDGIDIKYAQQAEELSKYRIYHTVLDTASDVVSTYQAQSISQLNDDWRKEKYYNIVGLINRLRSGRRPL